MEMTTKHFVIFGAGILAGYLLVDYLRKNPTTPQTTLDGTLHTTIYNCKDGTKVSETIDVTKAYTTQYKDPCVNNGGIVRYTPMPLEA